jgi:signal transduction histidine kinase/CheY-like chemotaxis protein
MAVFSKVHIVMNRESPLMPQDDLAPALPDFLAHGGAMAAVINALDWRPSPLRAFESWPASLKCVLATVLGSPRPMYVLWGPELLFFFNDAYAPMLGQHGVGAMGRPFAQVWPELWAGFEPMLRQALRGQGSTYDNMPLALARHGYAEPTWWTFSFLPLRDERGALVGVHCICSETTQLVWAQRALAAKQAQQAFCIELGDALRETTTPEALMAMAAEKLGQYLQASCVGYGEIDEAGQCCRVHQDWTAGDFRSVAGQHRLDNFAVLRAGQLRAGRTVAVHDIDRDLLTTRGAPLVSNQPMRHKALIVAPLVKNGRFAALLFVLNAAPRVWTGSEQALVEEVAERTWVALQRLQAERDLRLAHEVLDHRTTELLHSENALRQSQKLDALGQLTGGVAHDVNNLLSVISSAAELLRSPSLPEDQRSQYLERILDTVGRAAKLTGQLLAFARQQPLKTEEFDVGQRLHSVLDLVRPLLGEHVQIDLQGGEEKCCRAEADISQFETALVNLVVNARDAMNAQGRISVKVNKVDRIPEGSGKDARPGDRLGNFVAISIADTGSGMAADQLEAIFAPFYTTKAVGKGTGLGLSQVFDFAKQSGGKIAVSSEPGQGAVFTLFLPVAQSAPLPAGLAPPLEANAHGVASQIAVLVVEDNDILGEMTCDILAAQGYQAVWAASAAAALELLATPEKHFDLVFSDVVMPGMSGIKLGMQVRQRYPGLPVVLTSGYNAVMAQEGKYGFDLVLKPYTLDTLERAFGQALADQAG